ncbi:hypothetical protein ABZ953_35085 [Streptomyces sp. NPDC046465]|uniref:hypothetical protein n=1 Tax=Streptomyces sp. NPDC046465 TaxID=3155810 RepID=UPI0034016C05
MLTSADTWGFTNTFERCELLRRAAADAVAKARRMQSESAQIRLRAAQTRADLRRGSAAPPPPVAVPEAAARPTAPRPAAPRPDTSSPTVDLAALAAFLHARLDEEAASAHLFHEADCSAVRRAPVGPGPVRCGCLAPRRLHQKISTLRDLAHANEAAVREADPDSPGWPFSELAALLDLQALALPYELHELWCEEWRP